MFLPDQVRPHHDHEFVGQIESVPMILKKINGHSQLSFNHLPFQAIRHFVDQLFGSKDTVN